MRLFSLNSLSTGGKSGGKRSNRTFTYCCLPANFFISKTKEMANTIKVLLWLRRNKINSEGLAPLMLRLSYQNNKTDKATGYYVNPNDWNIIKQRLKGSKNQAKQINEWIDDTMVKIADCYREEAKKANVHLPSLINKLFVKVKEEPGLLQTMFEHNEQLRLRVDKDFAYSTYEKYVFTYNKVKAFIEGPLKKKDILLRDITTRFIMDFDHYLRVHDKNQHNTVVKYCINLKRILNVVVLQGILAKSPFTNHKTIYKDTVQVYLNEQEVLAIDNITLDKPKYLLTRDLFLFQCSTGLAYTDMVGLSHEDVSTDALGRKWIVKPRQKSGIVSTIPLLPKALEIISKYNADNKTQGVLFPSYSIQKYNEYIAEIGVLSGIHKRLSSHVGRRTFGNIALARGVSLNVISKILGHSNTLITQRIYAITTQNIITKEIEKW